MLVAMGRVIDPTVRFLTEADELLDCCMTNQPKANSDANFIVEMKDGS